MNNLEQSLKELIVKNLPEYAAKEMKTYIEEAERNSEKLKNSEKALSDLMDNFNKVSREFNDLKQQENKLKEREQELNKKEQEILNKERSLKIAELEYKLTSERESNDKVFKLVDKFVSNPRAIEMISRNQSISNATYYDGHRTQYYPTSSYETGTIEKTETK